MQKKKINKGLVRELLLIGLVAFFILMFLYLVNYAPLP